jgi:hypothetical protein
MGNAQAQLKDLPNLADTCAATLALIRTGSTPTQGPHAENIRKGIAFISREIEAAEEAGLYVTSVRGTRLQTKLGQYIDTFLAAMLLAEVKDQMPDDAGREAVARALAKVMRKIEKHQNKDGTWGNEGWAPVLAEGLAAKAINRVAQSGVAVNRDVLALTGPRAQRELVKETDGATVSGVSAAGSAGVELYAYAANLASLQDCANTNEGRKSALLAIVTTAPSDDKRSEAEASLAEIKSIDGDLENAQKAVVDKLSDKRFIAGFGSNGGEEFLSYMNIGESLVVKGGDEWTKWDKQITENLNRIQNQDGSWTGHHCITGRTFCTSAALLVLTVDRAPVPVAAKIGKR